MERLQKVIANSGYCSRRKAEELISAGKVRVNSQVISELGFKVDGNDEIMIGNKVISREEKEYILLNKPRGVVTTTSDEKNRKTVIDLIDTDKRLYPVGRLDYDTTGNKVDKVYIAKVKGFFDKESALNMSRGVLIDGVKTAKSFVKLRKYDKKSDSSIVEVIIHEGKNHQVKKMFEAVGFDVLKLKREMFAFLNVNGLKSGEYRYLFFLYFYCAYWASFCCLFYVFSYFFNFFFYWFCVSFITKFKIVWSDCCTSATSYTIFIYFNFFHFNSSFIYYK